MVYSQGIYSPCITQRAFRSALLADARLDPLADARLDGLLAVHS
jgi:hypothetical protein